MKTYCQHEKNWQTLNQMPTELYDAMRANMVRVNDEKCRLTQMGEHVPATGENNGSR